MWGVLFSYYNEAYPNQLVALSWIGSLFGDLSPIVGPFYAWISARIDDRYVVSASCILSTFDADGMSLKEYSLLASSN